jgi:hypothetical protein
MNIFYEQVKEEYILLTFFELKNSNEKNLSVNID